MSKETRSFAGKLENCRECNGTLNHEYFSEEQMKQKKDSGMNLGENQRLSFCEKCEIEYVNSKS